MRSHLFSRIFTWQFLKWVAAAIAWITLMCSRFLVMLGQEENRMCYFWTGWDSTVLLTGIAVAGLGLAVIWAFLHHVAGKRWMRRWRSVVVFLACFGLIQLLPVQGAAWVSWTMLGLGILLAVAANWHNGLIWEWTGIVMVSLFALYFLFLFQSFQWESFADADGKSAKFPTVMSSTADSPSVLLVIFDSVGAEDVYDENECWKASYPAFSAFGKECVTFADAQSPGRHTGLSIPGLLLQRPMKEESPSPWRYWREVDQNDAWLLRAKQAGHVRTLIGDYLPWGMMLKEQPDFMDVRAYNGLLQLSNGWKRAVRDVWLAVDVLQAPWGRFWNAIPKVKWWAVTADTEYRHNGKQIQWKEFRKISIEGAPTGQTILFHSNLTHDSDYLEDGTLAPTLGTPESELTYVDREFGKWVAEMKSHGKWNGAWILLTADHSKGQGRRHRHVPFAVKAPGNFRGGTWVKGTLPLWQLTPFLKSMYDGNSPEASMAILEKLANKREGEKE